MAKAKWKQIIDIETESLSNRDLLDAVYEAATTCGADEQEASSRDFYYYERATDVLEQRLKRYGFLQESDGLQQSASYLLNHDKFQYADPCWQDNNMTRTILEIEKSFDTKGGA